MIGNFARGLFGGMFDGQPGMFSQHQGGLRGLLGSFNDGQAGNVLFGAPQLTQAPVQSAELAPAQVPSAQPANDWRAMVQMAERPQERSQGRPQERPRKDVSGWRTFQDWAFEGISPAKSREAQLARAAANDQREAMTNMARQVITDPREWMVFQSDPEAWAKENAERFGSDVLSQGQMLTHGGQTVNAAPVYEKFEDRFGWIDPMNRESGFTAPRGPTFAEETDATKTLADIERQLKELELKRQTLALEREKHNARVKGGGYGTPGVGVAAPVSMGGVPDGWEVE